jgi:hypothetical protein
MITIPTGLPAELVPLSWLLGVWEGTGVLDYTLGETHVQHEFGQRVSFSNDGLPYLNYNSYTWLIGESGETADSDTPDASDASSGSDVPDPDATDSAEASTGETSTAETNSPLVTETGYWRLGRALTPGDPGPGMLPGVGQRPFTKTEAVETLRNADGGFDLEVSIVHPDGVSELYLGQIKGPRIDLATDAVIRSGSAKEYKAATRLYGLVDGHLLWAWDIAALGQDLRTHASARLAKVD